MKELQNSLCDIMCAIISHVIYNQVIYNYVIYSYAISL